jgi:hypothetical protein
LFLLAFVISGCPKSKYDDFSDAPQSDRSAAENMWTSYLNDLGDRKVSERPFLVARYFARPLIANTTEEEFNKHLRMGLKRRGAGAFRNVKVEAVKESPSGLLLVLDSKAGEMAVPLTKEGDQVKFAELKAATGEWTGPAKRGSDHMPERPSLLYIKMVLADKQAPVGARLRAAVALSEKKYRQEIIRQQRTVTDPIVRLGLGLARIRIDGSDESFIRNFPADAVGISALAQADAAIFEEMMTKMANLGAMVEDPPANEALYRTAGGAPPDLRARMGKALYDMAEAGPARMANAVRNVATDPATDKTFDIYLEEVKRRGQAPRMKKFLRKFSRIGEQQERRLCKALLSRLEKTL